MTDRYWYVLGFMKERALRGRPQDGWTRGAEISALPKAEVQKAIRRLRKDGRIEMGKRGMYRPT